ncbi:hypothetical protein GUITHDRAFT_117571 [Guillardia theta CCMP2712]|uniref:PDZ domain-containing protein n=1 Tax=Guillardia theta (strain CCMP2712) TaxID=905079 RepID=L1IK85_GUITC|nr:hypothetical protein GUITHDRAFT_117571 [Guillardia theta CCMP2712]EKX36215.1 hypothetical protein GUITHDRAFT_117571 [Guillardia theta CCMP2712]|eukprot:XP_005823195.1 hypothetical protein GUITHDRAFT_117571 [Guillardia theta CCMP2712]
MLRACCLIEDYIQRFEITTLKDETCSMDNPMKARTTFGLMLKDDVVDNTLVGGSAHRLLRAGDRIVRVEGRAFDLPDLHALMLGDDVPGSHVEISVAEPFTGRVREVCLQRMESGKLGLRRRMFELFTCRNSPLLFLLRLLTRILAVKHRASSRDDQVSLDEIQECLSIWSNLMAAEDARWGEVAESVKRFKRTMLDLVAQVKNELRRQEEVQKREQLHSMVSEGWFMRCETQATDMAGGRGAGKEETRTERAGACRQKKHV